MHRRPPRPDLPHLLAIEDDPELGLLLVELLSDLARVEVAVNWADARALLAGRRYALILLDLYLPDAGLLEPLEAIRAIDPDYPVIVMSGNLERDDAVIERLMRLGIETILPKPFSWETLREKAKARLGTGGPGLGG